MFSKKVVAVIFSAIWTMIVCFIFVFAMLPCTYSMAEEKKYQNPEKRYTIDRFEEDFAVLEREDCSTFNIPKNQLPQEAKEGDVITDRCVIDRLAAESIKNDIMELLQTVLNAKYR